MLVSGRTMLSERQTSQTLSHLSVQHSFQGQTQRSHEHEQESDHEQDSLPTGGSMSGSEHDQDQDQDQGQDQDQEPLPADGSLSGSEHDGVEAADEEQSYFPDDDQDLPTDNNGWGSSKVNIGHGEWDGNGVGDEPNPIIWEGAPRGNVETKTERWNREEGCHDG